jgi:hypothetical protein
LAFRNWKKNLLYLWHLTIRRRRLGWDSLVETVSNRRCCTTEKLWFYSRHRHEISPFRDVWRPPVGLIRRAIQCEPRTLSPDVNQPTRKLDLSPLHPKPSLRVTGNIPESQGFENFSVMEYILP